MDARVPRVVRTAPSRDQIGFVAVERFADGERAAFVDGLAGLPPCERARLIDRLPKGKDVRRGSGFKIIGEGDFLDPLGTAVGNPHRPRSGGLVSPVPEMDAGADRGPVWFLAHLELAAGSWGFKLGGARLRHGSVSDECP